MHFGKGLSEVRAIIKQRLIDKYCRSKELLSESLIATGKLFGINEFLLVQWLAPIASETPEFVVAIMFALRGKPEVAFGSLLAAKLNQWTLLVGMIPGVFAISHGSIVHSMPMSQYQLHEILLTDAQSLLAVIVLLDLKFYFRHAFVLMLLFFGQLASPVLVESLPGHSLLGLHGVNINQIFTLLYITASLILIMENFPRYKEIIMRHSRFFRKLAWQGYRK